MSISVEAFCYSLWLCWLLMHLCILKSSLIFSALHNMRDHLTSESKASSVYLSISLCFFFSPFLLLILSIIGNLSVCSTSPSYTRPHYNRNMPSHQYTHPLLRIRYAYTEASSIKEAFHAPFDGCDVTKVRTVDNILQQD